jgi:hypothetical protein
MGYLGAPAGPSGLHIFVFLLFGGEKVKAGGLSGGAAVGGPSDSKSPLCPNYFVHFSKIPLTRIKKWAAKKGIKRT